MVRRALLHGADFIAQTGIAEVRGAIAEEDEKKKSKQRARERVQPKMGRVDIDYQVLHDAFFRFQTKPKLTQLGDMYVVYSLRCPSPTRCANELVGC